MKIFLTVFGICAISWLLNGCSNDTEKAAFSSAAPEVKACWSQAIADSRANHYVAANTNLVSLLHRDLNPAQMAAVQGALNDLNVRMNDAAAGGNAEAKKALETLQSMQQTHRAPGGSSH